MTAKQGDVVLVVTRDGRAIEYKRSECYIKFGEYGITVIPKPEHKHGWTQRVHPWGSIGTVEERTK